jgi:hypothetical protein
MSIPWYIYITPAVFALIGALGAQYLNYKSNLKAKKIELLFNNKSKSYHDFMIEALNFGTDPKNKDKYLRFFHAYQTAILFANDEVKESLACKTGVNIAAQRLKLAESDDEIIRIQCNDWHKAMENITKTMRSDLQNIQKY